MNLKVFSYHKTTIAVSAWQEDTEADFETLWKAQKVVQKLDSNRSKSRFIARELREHYDFQFVSVAKNECHYVVF